MPRYRVTYEVETPLEVPIPLAFDYANGRVTISSSNAYERGVLAEVECEAETWMRACSIGEDDILSPVLNVIALHRKTFLTAMMVNKVVRSDAGAGRKRCVLIQKQSLTNHPNLDTAQAAEIQNSLNTNTLPRPTLKWLRYSYRDVPRLDEFLFKWLAFENECGTAQLVTTCACGREQQRPVLDKDAAFAMLNALEPNLTVETFRRDLNHWRNEVRNPILHGGRDVTTELREQLISITERIGVATENHVRRNEGWQLHYRGRQPLRSQQQLLHHRFVEFDSGNEGFPARTPTYEETQAVFEDHLETGLNITILDWADSRLW